jgi:fatty acid desaturase
MKRRVSLTNRRLLNVIVCLTSVAWSDSFSISNVQSQHFQWQRHQQTSTATTTTTTGSSFPFLKMTATTSSSFSTDESSSSTSMPNKYSPAAHWHRERRKQILEKYGNQILPLERESSSQQVAFPLLILGNASLLVLALWSGIYGNLVQTLALAIFPGSMLSLWQLQILHDCLHGSLFQKGIDTTTKFGITRKKLQDRVLFWGSMPSVFGYYLYLRYGHLTHHMSVGDPAKASLAQLFDSSSKDFEDGDVLFVAHRMHLKGPIGPRFQIQFPWKQKVSEITMSISKSGFGSWRRGNALWNISMFATSFLFERILLMWNDVVVALTGRNYFFPNKPQQFHDECATYCRWAVLVRSVLLFVGGWKSLLFLYLSETCWSIPPHPASAMFVTNHGSGKDEHGNCLPTSSTYAGRWYSLFTLGTNYHCEHHDFPTIPLHKLGKLREIAPEFYPQGSMDRNNLWRIMRKAFAYPDFYACMDAGAIATVGGSARASM